MSLPLPASSSQPTKQNDALDADEKPRATNNTPKRGRSSYTLTPEAKQKIDSKSMNTDTYGKGVKDRILQWQEICATSPSLDVSPTRAQSADDQRISRPRPQDTLKSRVITDTSDKQKHNLTEERGRRQVTRPAPITPVKKYAATAPRKRVVSDEHWVKNRVSRDPPKIVPKGQRPQPSATVWTDQDGKAYNAWVRKKSAAAKTSPAIQPIPKATVRTPAVLTTPVVVTNQQAQNDEDAVGTGIHSGSPKIRRHLLDHQRKSSGPSRRARVRESPTTDLPPKEIAVRTPSSDERTLQIPVGSRIQAWLTDSSDPFVDSPSKTSRRRSKSPAEIGSNRSSPSPSSHGRSHSPDGTVNPMDSISQGPWTDPPAHIVRKPQLRRQGARRMSAAVRSASSPHREMHGDTLVASSRKPSRNAVSAPNTSETSFIAAKTARSSPEPRQEPTPLVISRSRPILSSDAMQLFEVKNAARKSTSKANKITSHADLMSVLSMPVDTTDPLRPARSLRSKPPTTDMKAEDVLRQLTADEVVYQRELRTLVDGVIPVLLKSVLSRSKSALSAGLITGSENETIATTPIVTMGIALERLKATHRRLATDSAEAFASWAQQAHRAYADYLSAWRLGFEDMMITLAPAAKETLPASSIEQQADIGEKADVAYLLKRPLVRIKHIAKALKAISTACTTTHGSTSASMFQDLLVIARRRQSEERARLEDEAASNIDTSKARGLRTLDALLGTRIDRFRSVRARDYFDLKIEHSTGQRIDCRAELIVRDEGPGSQRKGDLLICEMDSTSRWLLFPPMPLECVSARIDRTDSSLVIMLRQSASSTADEAELLVLSAGNSAALNDWVQMLGSNPIPPSIPRPSALTTQKLVQTSLDLVLANPTHATETNLAAAVPIGEPPPLPGRSSRAYSQVSPRHIKQGSTDIISHEINAPRTPTSSIVSARSAGPRSPRKSSNKLLAAPHSSHSPLEEHIELSSDRRSSVSRSSSKSYSVWMPSQADERPNGPEPPLNDSAMHPTADDPRRSRNVSISNLPPDNLSDYGRVASRYKRSRTSAPRVQDPDNSIDLQSSPYDKISSSTSEQRFSESTSTISKPSSTNEIYSHPIPQLSPQVQTPNSGRRRASSPLKYEYEPSTDSGCSSIDGVLQSDDDQSVASDSSVEDDDIIPPLPPLHVIKKAVVPPEAQKSPQSTPPATVTPSQSASQAPYREVPVSDEQSCTTTIASIFAWSEKGRWDQLHPEECCIIVSPGLIEAFELKAAHVRSAIDPLTGLMKQRPQGLEPLIALELTPLVPLRRGTALDISVRSPPTGGCKLRVSDNIMFRSRSPNECDVLYGMLNQARINNPTYIALQNARGPFGQGMWSAHMEQQGRGAPSSWWRFLGKKSSYRAGNTRRTASVIGSESSIASMSSAIAALKRFSTGSKMFDVARSTITSRRGGQNASRSSTTFSSSSGIGSGSGSSTPIAADLSGGAGVGITNTKIRIYQREVAGRWRDMGSARLTIMQPPRPAGAPPLLDRDGRLIQEKRVVVLGKTQGETILDVTLGESSFERVARTGLAVSVWEDFGKINNTGGVNTARANVYMLQMKSEAEAAYAFSLVGRLRY